MELTKVKNQKNIKKAAIIASRKETSFNLNTYENLYLAEDGRLIYEIERAGTGANGDYFTKYTFMAKKKLTLQWFEKMSEKADFIGLDSDGDLFFSNNEDADEYTDCEQGFFLPLSFEEATY